jgi:hypothetical protein
MAVSSLHAVDSLTFKEAALWQRFPQLAGKSFVASIGFQVLQQFPLNHHGAAADTSIIRDKCARYP